MLPILAGGIRLLSIYDIKKENCEFAASAYLVIYGLLTIATTIGGNSICIDLNNKEQRIIICDKSWFSFNKELRKVEISCRSDQELMEIYNKYGTIETEYLSFDTINKYFPVVSKNFYTFLNDIADNKINDIEDFFKSR